MGETFRGTQGIDASFLGRLDALLPFEKALT